jgi:hypothetical protein
MGNHRHRQLPPSPHRSLRKIRQPVGTHAKVALLPARDPVATVLVHRGEAARVETGAERAALAGQHHRPQAFFPAELIAGCNQCLKHRGVERIHLVRPHQPDIGDAVRHRHRNAIVHRIVLPDCFHRCPTLFSLYRKALSGFSQSIN